MSDEKELNEAELKLYTKGFNSGYLLQKDNPELAKKLIEGNQSKESIFFKGLVAGSKEQVREKYIERAMDKMTKSKQKSKDKERD